MSDCRRTAERLTPYVDEALGAGERADVERHLDACPPCRTAAVHEQGGRTVLRERAAQLKAEPVPPGLRSRCEALAREHCGRGRVPLWRAGLLRGAVTAVLLVIAGAALLSFATHKSDTVLAAQLTADHMKCFRIFAHPQSPSIDSRALEEQLAGTYGWDVHIPPSSTAEDVQLIGARRCLYADGTIPHVMYRVHGHDVSLYMLEGVQRPPGAVMALGHRSEIWSRGATTYVLVSSAPAQDLARAVRYVKQEAR
jgi:anti-sigma factor RsiW